MRPARSQTEISKYELGAVPVPEALLRRIAHRQDTLVLLSEVAHTATLSSRLRLVVAIRHLARAAQALLADELNGLPDGARPEKASAGEAAETGEDDTPAEGFIGRKIVPRREG